MAEPYRRHYGQLHNRLRRTTMNQLMINDMQVLIGTTYRNERNSIL